MFSKTFALSIFVVILTEIDNSSLYNLLFSEITVKVNLSDVTEVYHGIVKLTKTTPSLERQFVWPH